MVGEEFGWVPLDGLTMIILFAAMLVVLWIPGFLVSLAIFPKKSAMAMSERLALSFGLGLTPPLILWIANRGLYVPVNAQTGFVAIIIVVIISILAFVKRGGNINLIEWYGEKEKPKKG